MKNKDYSDIENKLFEKADGLESGVNYSGAVRDSKNEARIKRRREENARGGYGFPGRQITAAVLTMVIVGAGTFGALKFLEKKGAERLAQQGAGSADTSGAQQSEKTTENVPGTDDNKSNADIAAVIEPVEYDPGDEYGGKFVYVTSGDKVYQPFVCSESLMAVIDYEPPKFAYSGKLNIVNNVKDREWTVLSTNIWFPGIQSYDSIFDNWDLKLICSWIDGHTSGTYRVTFKVTWDDPDDENAVIYYVDFVIKRTAVSEVTETVEHVEYDPKGQNHSNYLYVTSGDKVYHPFIHDKSATVKVGYVSPTFEYNGKISFVNNVKDRDWHILTLYSTDPEKPGGFTYYTYSDGSIEDITLTEPGTYFFYAEVTWDDPDDENAVIYFVEFYITKGTESDKFEDVIKFDIDYTDGTDGQYAQLSDDERISIISKLKCDAAEALGYSICLYDAAPVEVSMRYLTPCILDNNGEIMFDFQQSSDVWYAGKTPTGHPTFFCVKRHALTSNGWTYADLYAYDTVNKEETLVISVGPEGLHSQSNLRVFGDISYDEETKELKISFYEDKTNIWNPEDKATWPKPFATEPIKWNGEKYVVEGIDATRLSEESGNENKTEEEIKEEQLKAKTEEEANGRLYVTASGAKYYPVLINAEIFEDHKVYQFEYKNDPPVIEYSEPFEVKNRIRTLWTIHGIDAGNAGFADIDTFTEYLHKLSGSVTEDTSLDVTICVSWNNDNMYTYAFKLHIKANEGKQHTDVEPSGYAKFTVAAGKNAIAPYEYKEYDKVEVNEVNVTVNPAPDVIPVIDVYALGEYETIKYSYDTEAVTHVETRMGAYSGGTVLYSSPGSILTDARSMLRIPGASNVLYVESVFQKKDGSGKYISYIFAVSGGDPACYPFSSDGDGAAHFTVSDDNNTYAPRAKYFYCSDRSVIENSRFTELNLQYYNVPTVVLSGGLEFKMKDGYHISKVIAFKDTKATKQQVYHGFEGLNLSTWLSKQPWGEFYAAITVEKDGEDGEGKGYLTAYVIKVVLASSSSPETIEHIETADHSAQVQEMQSWLSQRMWYGMNEEELLNMAIEEKDLKPAILAAAPEQINHEDDGTFVRYKTEYCDFLYFAEADTQRIREARMILYSGTNYSLPFGITLDMSPEQALDALGYTAEQITAMDGYASSGNYELRYDDRFLILTYHCNGAYVGIELGSDPQMYIETAE